jgi:hypothetical protein
MVTLTLFLRHAMMNNSSTRLCRAKLGAGSAQAACKEQTGCLRLEGESPLLRKNMKL